MTAVTKKASSVTSVDDCKVYAIVDVVFDFNQLNIMFELNFL